MRKNSFSYKAYARKAFSLVGAILVATSIAVTSNAPVAQAQSSTFSLPTIGSSSVPGTNSLPKVKVPGTNSLPKVKLPGTNSTPKTKAPGANSTPKKQSPGASKAAIKLVPHPSKITYFEGVASIRLPWISPEGYSLAGCDFYRDRPESSGCGNVKIREKLSPQTPTTGWVFGRFDTSKGGAYSVRGDAPWFDLDTSHVMKEGERVIFDSYSCDFKSDVLTCVDSDTGTKVKVTRNDVVVS